MRNVLADLALESEAATALAMRLARAFDAQGDEAPALLRRVLTPAAKYWVCKRGPAVAAEAMEVLGGNGYVEEGPLARVYRQMPLNSIWEGAGNVMCLDVLRALARERECIDALAAELEPARSGNAHLDAYVERNCAGLREPLAARGPGARADAADRLARAGRAAGALLAGLCGGRVLRVAARAGSFAGGAFGQLRSGTDCASIIRRAWPT